MGWYPRISTGQLSFYRSIPKVELHRHLEGSLRLDTLLDIARQHGLTIPYTHFTSLVQMQREDPLTFTNFLGKFQTLRNFYRTPEIIQRVTREAVADAAGDGVRYLELRFTPVALSRMQGFSFGEVMDWVCQSAAEAALEFNISVRLIASVNRHEPVAMAEQVAQLAADRIEHGIVGLDLAGNEVEFSAAPFAGVFGAARQAGLHVTVHAGEWGGAANVREAVELLSAERIGHGVRVLEDPSVLALVIERGIVLEVCVTSNHQSGVVSDLKEHPIHRLIDAGVLVTINTDDPGISRITLTDEYRLLLEDLGMPPAQLKGCVLAGARAAFLPTGQREALASGLDPLITRLFQVW